MSEVVVRPMRARDVHSLSRLSHRGAAVDYGFYPIGVQEEIAHRNSYMSLLWGRFRLRRQILVGEVDGKIGGFLVGSPDNDGVAVVNWLFVDPDMRSHGLGRRLLDHFENHLPAHVHRLMLWTEIAPGYYEKLGWHMAASLPNHFWRQDFWIMTKERDAATLKTERAILREAKGKKKD